MSSTYIYLYTTNFFKLLIFSVFYFTLHLQTFTLTSTDATGIKFYQIIAALLLIPLLKTRQFLVPPLLINAFFACVVVISLIAYNAYVFDGLLIHYIIAYYIIFLVLNFFQSLPLASVIKSLQIVSALILLIVIVKDLFFIDELIAFILDPDGHPTIYFLYIGGPNLEATWLVIAGAFFINSRWLYPYCIATFFITILYASRTAMLLDIIVMLYPHIPKSKGSIIKMGVISLIMVIALVTLINLVPELYIFQRLLDIGNSHDNGSLGRLHMWRQIPEALNNSLFGYGAGNATYGISQFATLYFHENNVHNYFAQVLIDFGPLTFSIYLCLVLCVILRESFTQFKSPLGAFILLFLLASMTQFRGAEAIFWCIVGLYCLECTHIKEAVSKPMLLSPDQAFKDVS